MKNIIQSVRGTRVLSARHGIAELVISDDP